MEQLIKLLNAPKKSLLNDLIPDPELVVLVAAPHPDDFDAVAATLKLFRDNGNAIHLAVLSEAGNGVDDDFAWELGKSKAKIREEEQRASCLLFGLPETNLRFCHLDEDDNGQIAHTPDNTAKIQAIMEKLLPDIIFLPHGNDTNSGHRHVFSMVNAAMELTGLPAIGLLNHDPKTIEMRYDFFTVFDENTQMWKAELLRCHVSQQRRNQRARGYGFDERIARDNRDTAMAVPGAVYAEGFEMKTWNC